MKRYVRVATSSKGISLLTISHERLEYNLMESRGGV